jgi:outer membrane murein-binding lipoprotein Lpp
VGYTGPVVAFGLCLVVACSAPTPLPTPTAVATPTPAATPVPTLDAQVADVQYAFLSEVNDLSSDVETLASASCAEMTTETRANPTEVSQMHGFAATLQRVGSNQAALDNEDVRSALGDLTKAVTQLDNALTKCGIQ